MCKGVQLSYSRKKYLCGHRLANFTESFDLIFVDVDFSAYLPLVKQILDQNLLATRGIILVDNGAIF